MNRIRRLAPALAITALLGLAAACASSHTLNPDTTVYLTCAEQTAAPLDQKQIGPPGGFLDGGDNSFVIPGKALTANANFAMARLAGTKVGIEVVGTPAPPSLRREATVFISFAHCTPTEVGQDTARWKIARAPNLQAQLTVLSENGRTGNVLWGYTDHNSVFVIVAD